MLDGNDLAEEWFSNISKLDIKNSLKNGEFYSKDGSVLELNIDLNVVTAKVEGTPGNVFDVKITFSKFSKKDIKKINDYIYNHPLVYASMLNDEFPEDLLRVDVRFFPNSLKDIKMECNCNIKSLFCKHKSAVFYKIKNEIAKNPFLILSLSGFDVKSFFGIKKEIKSIEEILNTEVNIEKVSYEILNSYNYFFILKDYPSFFKGKNFKIILSDTLDAIENSFFRISNSLIKTSFKEYITLGNTLKSFEYSTSDASSEVIFDDKWGNYNFFKSFNFNFNNNYDLTRIGQGNDELLFNNLKQVLFAFLAELNQINKDELSYNIKFCQELFSLTSSLVQNSELMPEFFKLDNGKYHVRWIPTYNYETIEIIKKTAEKCPDNLVTFNNEVLSKYNQVVSLISFIFEGFCQYFISNAIPRNLEQFLHDKFFRLFFVNSVDLSVYPYKGLEYKINYWLSNLYFQNEDSNFIVDVTQKDEYFEFGINVELDGKCYSSDEIIERKEFDIIRNFSVIEEIFSNTSSNVFKFKASIYDIEEFLDYTYPVLKSFGIKVSLPDSFSHPHPVKLKLDLDLGDKKSLSFDDLEKFNWKISVGDDNFSIDDFNNLSKEIRGFIKIRDKFVYVSRQDYFKLKDQMNFISDDMSKIDLMHFLLSGDSDEINLDSRVKNLLENNMDMADIEIPQSLNAKLRNYQKIGFKWLVQNIKSGFGSILADDMGLGKTLQVLTTILYLKENNFLKDDNVLIVVPTSILTNWQNEIKKFTPDLTSYIYHGVNREFPEENYDILITSYGVLRHDIEIFNVHKWYLTVIDEAQMIKNPNTGQTKAVKLINADHKIALSGTPVENRLSEYWSIFDFTNRGYLHSLKTFRDLYIKPIENFGDNDALTDFKAITSPFILRRLKTDKNIIKDLPEKIINNVYCNLTLKQAALYEETLNSLISDVADSEGISRKGNILKLINSLKQICNHPSNFLKSEDYKISDSGKMAVLMNILENIIDSNEKVLIFTQYVEMGNIIKDLVESKFCEEILFLHGGTSRKKRDEMIDKFQNKDSKIFILSLKAGGLGLNLTAAQNVIHYDLWWNPAVENQATDRAYRIGQKDNVMVYRFITTGTLEERINQILLEKHELAEMTIEGNETFITEMSNDELINMLELRK